MFIKKLFLVFIIALTTLSYSRAGYFQKDEGQLNAIYNFKTFTNYEYVAYDNDLIIGVGKTNIEIIDLNTSETLNIQFDSDLKSAPVGTSSFNTNIYKGAIVFENCGNYKELELNASSNKRAKVSFNENGLNFDFGKIKYNIDKTKEYESKKLNSIFMRIKGNNKSNQILAKDFEIIWGTYLGGIESDVARCVRTDAAGAYYVTGNTASMDIPNLPSKTKYYSDIWVAKFNAKYELQWFTYMGSSNEDYVYSLSLNSKGDIGVGGESRDADFPVTSNAFQNYNKGGTADACVFKLSNSGNLLYSTYIGGSAYEAMQDVRFDKKDNLYGIGRTQSSDFKETSNALISPCGTYDVVLFKLSPGDLVELSSRFGGTSDDFGEGLDILSNGNLCITGYTISSDFPLTSNAEKTTNQYSQDVFLTIIDPVKWELIYSSFFGGSGIGNDYGNDIIVGPKDVIYIHGATTSNDLPTNSKVFQPKYGGNVDDFMAKFDSKGKFQWCTYIGSDQPESIDDILDQNGGLSITPSGLVATSTVTNGSGLPTSPKALKKNLKGPSDDYVIILNESGQLEYATYLGGSSNDFGLDLVFDKNENLFVVGGTSSNDFPVLNPFQAKFGGYNDAFMVKLENRSYVKDNITISESSVGCAQTKLIITNSAGISSSSLNCYDNSTGTKVYDNGKDTVIYIVETVDKARGGKVEIDIINSASVSSKLDYTLQAAYSGSTFWNLAQKDSVIYFNKTVLGTEICQDFQIYNASNDKLNISKAFFLKNIEFSFPHSIMPITILPRDSIRFTACFTPASYTKLLKRDTLVLFSDCNSITVPMAAPPIKLDLTGESKCQVFVRIIGDSVSKISKFTVTPDPAGLFISLSNKEKLENASVSLYDLSGVIRSSVSFGSIDIGDYTVFCRCPNLETGVYILKLEYSGIVETLKYSVFK